MGLGEFCALACAIVWACAVILYTRLGDKMPAFELNLSKNTIGLVLLVITTLLVEGFQLPQMILSHWLLLIFSGLIGIALADTLYMQTLNKIGAGNTGIVAALYSPFVVIISMLYLDEQLKLWHLAGLALVLAGILLVSFEKRSTHISRQDLWSGILLGACSVFLTALGVVLIKPILEQQPFFTVSSIRLLAGVAGMILYAALLRRLPQVKQELSKPHNWKAITLSGFLGAYLAMILWLAGFKYTDASIAAILNETNSIFIILLAWLILKEPLSKRKMGGVTLTLTGVGVIIFS